jgi:hypothetical protein
LELVFRRSIFSAASARSSGERKRHAKATTPAPTVVLHLKDSAQLFHPFGPAPLHEHDLDAQAEAYIVANATRSRRRAQAIILHVDRPNDIARDARDLESGIHDHFARKVQLADRELRALLRRGWISLLIGLAFLGGLLALSDFVVEHSAAGTIAALIRESLLIGGWVALWRPLETFLYDWWPIVGRRRTYATLARIPVRVVTHETSEDADQIGKHSRRVTHE